VPVVWLKHDDARAWRDPDGSQPTSGATPSWPPDTISVANETAGSPPCCRNPKGLKLEELAEPECGGFPMLTIREPKWGRQLSCPSLQAPSTALPQQSRHSIHDWDPSFFRMCPSTNKCWAMFRSKGTILTSCFSARWLPWSQKKAFFTTSTKKTTQNLCEAITWT